MYNVLDYELNILGTFNWYRIPPMYYIIHVIATLTISKVKQSKVDFVRYSVLQLTSRESAGFYQYTSALVLYAATYMVYWLFKTIRTLSRHYITKVNVYLDYSTEM